MHVEDGQAVVVPESEDIETDERIERAARRESLISMATVATRMTRGDEREQIEGRAWQWH